MGQSLIPELLAIGNRQSAIEIPAIHDSRTPLVAKVRTDPVMRDLVCVMTTEVPTIGNRFEGSKPAFTDWHGTGVAI